MPDHRISHIYSVSHLTREIKTLLEERFSFVWITGEISNSATPASGHSYFSLKDDQAVISGVMFKNQKRNLKFTVENGMKINGLARLTLYEPRGAYQLIFEHMEPAGTGALQKAFEQLKKKLGDEGLFDAAHKQPIPFFPGTISVITSGTGAAVRDISHISLRRYPNCRLEIFPAAVQGDSAPHEIVCAIDAVNLRGTADVIILARGGGSLEDLSAFNSEPVARAIFKSRIPVITGIGHETDFTIADFVADLRAPTPSAAAELAVPEKKQLFGQLTSAQLSLTAAMNRKLIFFHQKVDDLQCRLKSPVQIMTAFGQTVASLCLRMQSALHVRIGHASDKLSWISNALVGALPDPRLSKNRLERQRHCLSQAMHQCMEIRRTRMSRAAATLTALNPGSVLNRGYSITRTLPGKKVILDAGKVAVQDPIETILSNGRILTRVEKVIHGENDV